MNENLLITVVTVVLNGEKTLERTIKSVLNQTYKNIEYIIVDGGSTDGTLEIIKRYENQIARWVSGKDKGIADAMNKGIEMATGDIIGILNADDRYELRALEKVAKNMSDSDILAGNIERLTVKDEYCFLYRPTFNRSTDCGIHMGWFIRKEVYAKKKYDLKYSIAADIDFIVSLHRSGKYRFRHLDEVLGYFYGGGVSSTRTCRTFYEISLIYLRHRQFFGLIKISFLLFKAVVAWTIRKLFGDRHFMFLKAKIYKV